MIINILGLYAAFVGLIILHEIVRAPEKWSISFKYGLPTIKTNLPNNSYMPLLIDLAIFVSVMVFETTNVLLQYLGIVAWAHFVIFLIIGTLVTTKDEQKKIFPKIGKGDAWIAIPIAIITFLLTKDYFIALIQNLIQI